MRRRCSALLAAAGLVAVLAGCTAPTTRPVAPVPSEPGRASWQLGHRIAPSSGLRVEAWHLSATSEWSSVRTGPTNDDECFVIWHAPGSYGPEYQVGDQIAVEVAGRPGVRSGAGAERGYLMWQLPDRAWTEVHCYPDESPRTHLRVAEAVVWQPSSVALPFDLPTLPAGYGPTTIETDLRTGTATVRLGPGPPAADGELQISFDGPVSRRGGRSTTVGGRAATLTEDPRWPAVCFVEQGHRVCVGVESSDTGPHPNRSGELPALLAIAEAVRFPTDLDDRSTWFPAEDVFG